MTSPLSKLLKKDTFDEHLFEQMFLKNSQEITSDLALLYKSLRIENILAFHWAAQKVKWDDHLENLIQILLPKASLKKYYDILYTANPTVVMEHSETILKALIKSYSWSSGENRKQRHEIIEQLFDKGATINEQDILDNLLHDIELHPFLFRIIKRGTLLFHKNNFFAEYCKIGNIEGAEVFKNIGCDLHYLNDLPLKNAAQRKNEKMVRYLIDKEEADPSVSNYFIFFSLLKDDKYSEVEPITSEMFTYLAQLAKKIQIPEFLLEKFEENRNFSIMVNYLKTEDKIANKSSLIEQKRLKV